VVYGIPGPSGTSGSQLEPIVISDNEITIKEENGEKKEKKCATNKKGKGKGKEPETTTGKTTGKKHKKNKPSAKKLKEKLGPARSLFLQPAAVQVVRVLARALARALTKPFTLKRNTCRKTSGRP